MVKLQDMKFLPISALNFVLEDALGGGVTRSLAIDMHGKTLGSALLEMRID